MKKAIHACGAIAALAFCLCGTTFAATPTANSYKYFDETGALVGQQILLCSNLAYHAGNIHTAYKIVEQTKCGSGGIELDYIVPGTIITSYTLPGFLTISNACSIAECEPAYAPEPERLTDKGWTFQSGWQ